MDVDARVIDTDIAALSASEEWLAQASERAALIAEQYRPHEIADDADYKESKTARADARRAIAAIDQERKSMTATIEKAVRDFKAGAKLALEPLSTIDAQYKEALTAYESAWKTQREIELHMEYGAVAPDLVNLVPFELVLKRYGSERGKAWVNRSTNIEAAKDMLADAVISISEAEEAIDEMAQDESYRSEVKAQYFRTLDLQGAMAEAKRTREQQERVRKLEEERIEREREFKAQVAQAVEQAPIEEPIPSPAPKPTLRNRMRMRFTFNEPVSELVLDLTVPEIELLKKVFADNGVHGRISKEA